MTIRDCKDRQKYFGALDERDRCYQIFDFLVVVFSKRATKNDKQCFLKIHLECYTV